MDLFGFLKKEKKQNSAISEPLKEFNFITEMNINEILNEKDRNTFFVAITFWLERKCNYGESFEQLSIPEKYVYVVHVFFDETMNGGFEQFLFNSSGTYLEYFKGSVVGIGAESIFQIYAEALKLIPNKLPNDENARDEVLFKIFNDDLSNNLSECDRKLYAIGQKYLEDRIYLYVMENQKYFTD